MTHQTTSGLTPKIIMKLLFLLIFTCLYLININCFPTQTQETKGKILFEGSFESGNLGGWGQETCRDCPDAIRLVTNPVRQGNYAVRFELCKSDPAASSGSWRTELKLPAESKVQVERWYGFSIFLPSDYTTDPSQEIVAQWHSTPDLDQGEDWRSPPLYLSTMNGDWYLSWRWDARPVTNPAKEPQGKEVRNLGPYRIGKWTDWVFHVKWSYDNDGLIEVWQNGQRVLRYHGPNAYNDLVGVYFKTGIYKWDYAPTSAVIPASTYRVLYVDEVRVGDEHVSYYEVVPGGW